MPFWLALVLVGWPYFLAWYLHLTRQLWGTYRPARHVMPLGCAGTVVSLPLCVCFVLTEHQPLMIVPAMFGSVVFWYSAMMLVEQIVWALGLKPRPKPPQPPTAKTGPAESEPA